MDKNLYQMMNNFIGSIDNKNSYEYDGYKVPRVTQIISKCINSDGIAQWANSLGFKRLSYRKTLDTAAEIGTITHNNIDEFLIDNNHIMDSIMSPIESQYAYKSFLKWYNDIISVANIEVIMHEKTLVCKYFGGTLDGLYKINNKIFLVDYKTSNHVRYNYTLQLAAYRYMLRELLNININGCIILQLSKSQVAYNEYVLNFDNPDDLKYMDDCEHAFMAMVYSYYNINKIENEYKLLNWR